MDNITNSLKKHYESKFEQYGESSQGVDWGDDQAKLDLRYEKMLNLFKDEGDSISVLDVGCGFGGFLDYLLKYKKLNSYVGIDVVEDMVKKAQKRFSEDKAVFRCENFLEAKFDNKPDFVVCNGILTQKLDTPAIEMDKFAHKMIRKMFELSNKGVAFNVMSTKVNFFANNLYYRNPSELLSWCMSELTTKIKLDHSYPLYEYTIYLYKDLGTEHV